jgi:hypothetical protein
MFGNEALRTVSDLFFDKLATAPASFFSAANNNLLTGTESALSATSLQMAIKQLRLQADPDGRTIGMVPRVLVVPPSLEGTARSLLNSQQLWRDGTADLQPSGNMFAPLNLELVVESRLEAYSATSWYLSSGPQGDGLLIVYLRGRQAIHFDSDEQPPQFLGVLYRAYLDVGVSLGDHRAIVKATGVA